MLAGHRNSILEESGLDITLLSMCLLFHVPSSLAFYASAAPLSPVLDILPPSTSTPFPALGCATCCTLLFQRQLLPQVFPPLVPFPLLVPRLLVSRQHVTVTSCLALPPWKRSFVVQKTHKILYNSGSVCDQRAKFYCCISSEAVSGCWGGRTARGNATIPV